MNKHIKFELWLEAKYILSGCMNYKDFSDKLSIKYETFYNWIKRRSLPSYEYIGKLRKVYPNDDWEWLLTDD